MDLQESVRKGDLEKVKELIHIYGLPIDSEWTDYVLLNSALKHGHTKVAKFLIDKGCRVNKSSELSVRNTPLHYAVKLDDINIVKILLNKGSSIVTKNHKDDTPLHLAFMRQNNKIVDHMLLSIYFSEDYSNPKNARGLTHMHIACIRNNTGIVSIFLESGEDVNISINLDSPSWPGYTSLHFAVEFRCLDTVRLLLEHDAKTNIINTAGLNAINFARQMYEDTLLIDYFLSISDRNGAFEMTHFYSACLRGEFHIVKKFLEYGVSVNSTKSKFTLIDFGDTPLHYAVNSESPEVINLLLSYGADITKPNGGKVTPIHLAFYLEQECREEEFLELLFSNHNFNSYNWTDCYGLSYFHIACTRSDQNIIKHFLDNGVNVNSHLKFDAKFFGGYTALHFAVESDKSEIVQLLMSHGANINSINSNRMTPIHLAFYLLDNIKDVIDTTVIDLFFSTQDFKNSANLTDCNNISYFHIACIKDDYKNIVDHFLKQGVDPNTCVRSSQYSSEYYYTNSGYTPLHFAAQYNCPKIIKLLLKYGADIQSGTCRYGTPLHVAFQEQNANSVEILLENGADCNAINVQNGRNMLHTLFLQDYSSGHILHIDHCKYIKALVQLGCDINHRDLAGDTPLHLVCYNMTQHHTSIHTLLNYGADINIINNNGQIPFRYTNFQSYKSPKYYMILYSHVEKLKLIGLYVSQKNQDYCLQIFEEREEHDPEKKYFTEEYICQMRKQFLDELEKMKHIKLDNYSSLYDILFKNCNKMAFHSENRILHNILTNKDFDQQFPAYGYLLNLQFQKGLARKKLLGPTKDALKFLTGQSLPDPCCENIFHYLSNKDLSALTTAASRSNSIVTMLK